MDPVLLKKKQRQAVKMNCSREIQKAQSVFESGDVNVQSAEASLAKIVDYRSRLDVFNNEILASIDTDADIDKEILTAAEYDDTVLDSITDITTKITHIKVNVAKSSKHNDSTASSVENKFNNIKLPKLEIDTYNGDPLLWEQFWDSFESTIHDNENLSDVDKFKYLRSFLGDEALRFVEGYRLTNANYAVVIEALTERFGNKQTIIFSHLEAFLALPTSNHDTNKLQAIYDQCEKHIRSLVALGLEEETFGQVFTPIILSKLPTFVKMELYRKNGSNAWTLSSLREFLRDEIRAREFSQRAFGATKSKSEPDQKPPDSDTKLRFGGTKGPRFQKGQGTSSSLIASEQKRKLHCSFCSGAHYTDQCQKFPDVSSRKTQIKGRCFVCLSGKHTARDCPDPRPCSHCQKAGHHRSLCFTRFGDKVPRKPVEASQSLQTHEKGEETGAQMNNTLLSHGEAVILQTAIADVRGQRTAKVRLLFDTGCSRSFVRTSVADQISPKYVGKDTVSIAGFGASKRKTVSYDTIEFHVVMSDGSTKCLTANVIPQISCPIKQLPIDPKRHPIVKQLQLAEPLVQESQMVEIDVLIGTDYYYDFIGTERLNCAGGLIFLSSTLGFIATGRVPCPDDPSGDSTSLLLSRVHVDSEPRIAVEQFWSLDDIGIKSSDLNDDDENALDQFNKSVSFVNGRYMVTWPWRSNIQEISNTYPLALGRLRSLLKRTCGNEAMLTAYRNTIQEQIEKGIVEEAPKTPSGDFVYYLPHHGVEKPGHATTKLRVVYDASAKPSKTSDSLNDCLHRGPVMLDDLCGLCLRFRLKPIALTSDIEKAFLQVGLHPNSRDVTRFLWVKDVHRPASGDNLVEYRFARVPFGVVSSPFLLAATVRHHVEQSKSDVAKDILGNIYVDNVIVGQPNVESAVNFYRRSKGLFEQASMNLREWYTNNPEVRNQLSSSDMGAGESTKVLGLIWDTSADVISCPSLPDQLPKINTKRLMLQYLAKVFDPCGFFSAVTVTGKMIIQKLWKGNFDWDAELPCEIVAEWSEYCGNLQQIRHAKLPRYLGVDCSNNEVRNELHCFCDASSKAYAAVVYLKTVSDGDSRCSLIFAKTRVAPVKQVTIPRLELLAVVVGSRILEFVQRWLQIPIAATTLWSDSQCVLHWLRNPAVSSVFVTNRVKEVRLRRNVNYRYVPSDDTPADISSRGCTTEQLVSNDKWWSGPSWLLLGADKWPKDKTTDSTDSHLSVEPRGVDETADSNFSAMSLVTAQARAEMSTDSDLSVADSSKHAADRHLSAAKSQDQSDDLVEKLLQRSSSLTKVLRTVAWIQRFAYNCRNGKKRVGPLTPDDVSAALLFLELRVQKQAFLDVGNSKNRSNRHRELNIFSDTAGLLRCRGRLKHAELSPDAKYPKLLPKHSPFTDLVIREYHDRLSHAGVSHTLSQVRYQYWVVNGRSEVKRVIRGCALCRRVHGGPFRVPEFPDLPEYRVHAQRPFQCVGVDYLGPLYIKDGSDSQVEKVWVCLFTCAAIRAVHLEVVKELSADQYIMCLRRFVALYGVPKVIISDNAKHFKVSANLMMGEPVTSATMGPEVQSYCLKNAIDFKFIPEFAPWMGGFYERLVGLVKMCLKKTLDYSFVNFVQLQTILSEVSSTLNTRPLTYLDCDAPESILTPSHFFRVPGHNVLTMKDCDDEWRPRGVSHHQFLRENWKKVNSSVERFWTMWRDRYLLSLREKGGHFRQRNTSLIQPKIGVVVLVKDNLPRNRWKMGVVKQLHMSRDGVCRSVTLKIGKKLFRRPVRILFPLEEGSSEDTDDKAATEQVGRPFRKTAVAARSAISRMLTAEDEQSVI